MEKETTNESGPAELEQQFFSALVRSSHIDLNRILADDFILIDVMRGAEIPKSALIAAIESGTLKFEAIVRYEEHLRFYRDTAIITGRTQIRGRFEDDPFSAHSRYTHVHVQQPSQWRLVSAQGTPIAPP
jgi:hypothetical protein